MPETAQLSDIKRSLLERYLRGQIKVKPATQTIPRRSPHDPLPLSYAQEQVWLHAQMAPDLPLYNEPVTIHYTGSLDVAALEQSFNEILRRHEAWRTCFGSVGGIPVQKVQPSLRLSLPVLDLRRLSGEQREAEALCVATEDAMKPLDLSQGPLFRARLIRLEDQQYRLYLTLNQIIFDGAAIYQVFLPELVTLYDAFVAGRTSPLPELPIQYPDYACWQRGSMSNETSTRDIEYWRRKLGGDLPALYLPVDRYHIGPQTFRGSIYPFTLSRSLTTALRALCRAERVSIFHILLAGFTALLYRYSGEERIAIGTVADGRSRPETQSLLGNFLNTVVLATDLSGNPSFREVVDRVKNLTIEALEHGSLPFEHLVRELQIQRDPSHSPLFQAFITIEPSMPVDIKGWSVATTQCKVNTGMVKFDLSLELEDGALGITGRFKYSTDLFDAETVSRMAAHWQRLLEGTVADLDQQISRVPILSESERHRVLKAWNNTSKDYPEKQCIHNLFERAAKRVPNRIAVECGDQSLTYRELDAKANRLANHLRESGVQPESCVGIFLERSLDLVVGLLGILKAGAAYVPMDPSFPPERLDWMIEDAGVLLLVTHTRLLKNLSRSGVKKVCLDTDWGLIEQHVSDDPGVALSPSSLAYVIYTSGSTGKPKGVMIEHRSVVNFLLSMQREPGFDESDVLVGVTTISFDIAALEFFLPLISGGRLVAAGRNEVVDGSALLEKISSSGATVLQATPATWKLMLEAGWKGTAGLKMLCGGESLPRELANRMLQRGIELWNMYGPTETTIWSSVERIQSGLDPVLIGRPIANTQFYIVDEQLEPVPLGMVGELLIAGDGLSRGYRNRPDLTAERFIETSFLNPGNRVYRTGDLARFRPDGRVELLGRLDHQVKVRGYRIELGEIEQVLSEHEAIKDTVVMTQGEQHGDKRLVAYYIPVAGERLNSGELRQFLQRKLPDYMIPSCFVEIEVFPLTPNGKIDRKQFPKPESIALEAGSSFAEPEGELELQLADIWKKALKRQNIGVNDNFFDLGGHSLLAAQVFAQIDRQIGVKLPLALLFQAPTIRQLATKIQRKSWKNSWKSLVSIQPRGDRPPIFLVHGAEGNVLLYKSLARSLGNNQPVYGLQSKGLDVREGAETKIEDMAAHYLGEIRIVQPKGPYFLGGYCLGGTIALEIAQQLRRAGESVAVLAMLETYNLEGLPAVSFPLRTIHKAQNLYFHLMNLWLSLSRGGFGFFFEKMKVELGRMNVTWNILWSSMLENLNYGDGLKYQHLQIRTVNDQAQAAYRPLPYDGKITVFRTKTHYRSFGEWDFGWGRIARQGVHVVELPHYPRGSLNDPFVEVLAKWLKAVIEDTFTSSLVGPESS